MSSRLRRWRIRAARMFLPCLPPQDETTRREETQVTQIIKALFGLLSPANAAKATKALFIAYGVLSAARDAVGAVLAALQ